MRLSIQEGELSWEHTIAEKKEKTFNASVVNDSCESSFGIINDGLTSLEIIGLGNAGGMAMAKNNGESASRLKIINKNSELIRFCYHIYFNYL